MPTNNPDKESLVPVHGGYRHLRSFQIAQLAFDVTVRFCDRYISLRSRTHDQMVQAARSGVQNIAEGSKASGTSKKTELKLTNVARASLEELKLDYEDFLRQRGLPFWAEADPRRRALVARRCQTADEVAVWCREVKNGRDGPDGRHGQKNLNEAKSGLGLASMPSIKSSSSISYPDEARSAEKACTEGAGPERSVGCLKPGALWADSAQIVANAAHVLVGVACTLLDRQIERLAADFEREGGFTERLYRVRSQRRRS